MRIAILALTLAGLAGPASGPASEDAHAVTGQAGYLGEWDLTATVTTQATGHFAGPFRMEHVGVCGADGPEVRTGVLRLRPGSRDKIEATMDFADLACTFSARRKDGYMGMLRCPDRRDLPMTLSIE